MVYTTYGRKIIIPDMYGILSYIPGIINIIKHRKYKGMTHTYQEIHTYTLFFP